jgi:hypothetical protein
MSEFVCTDAPKSLHVTFGAASESGIVLKMTTEAAPLTFRERWKISRLIRTVRRHRDAATRQLAIGRLAHSGDPRATQVIADAAAHDENRYVRASALAGLARLDAGRFAGLFSQALNDDDNLVVKTAIEGLIAVGDPRHAMDVAAYLSHELHDVRKAAATALHDWGWDTDDIRRAQVTLAREAWAEVAQLSGGAVAEVARIIADDQYWFGHGAAYEDSRRQTAIQALEQLMRQHAAHITDTDLRVVQQLASLETHVYSHTSGDGRFMRRRKVDLTGLRELCSTELQRRASKH